MPNDWWDWLGVVASLATVVSFALYVRERHSRQRQKEMVIGFLAGVRAQATGLAQAGEEWRYEVNKKPEGYGMGYANTAANGWISLSRELTTMLERLAR